MSNRIELCMQNTSTRIQTLNHHTFCDKSCSDKSSSKMGYVLLILTVLDWGKALFIATWQESFTNANVVATLHVFWNQIAIVLQLLRVCDKVWYCEFFFERQMLSMSLIKLVLRLLYQIVLCTHMLSTCCDQKLLFHP